MVGMCCFSGRLYTIESQSETEFPNQRYSLAVYSTTDTDSVMLLQLDVVDLTVNTVGKPRVDHQSGRVYIPCGQAGVLVMKYDGSELVQVTILRCLRKTGMLAVVSTDTLYVRDSASNTVCLVDVSQDRVIAKLQEPRGVKGKKPMQIHVAVLGDTIVVLYGGNRYRRNQHSKIPKCTCKLVIYRHGDPTSGKQLCPDWLQRLQRVSDLTTDHHSSFLLVDSDSHTVYVMDVIGNFTHTIPIPVNRQPWACTLVRDQVWLGCHNGDIIAMSSSQR